MSSYQRLLPWYEDFCQRRALAKMRKLQADRAALPIAAFKEQIVQVGLVGGGLALGWLLLPAACSLLLRRRQWVAGSWLRAVASMVGEGVVSLNTGSCGAADVTGHAEQRVQ